jgi:hypothetical protein
VPNDISKQSKKTIMFSYVHDSIRRPHPAHTHTSSSLNQTIQLHELKRGEGGGGRGEKIQAAALLHGDHSLSEMSATIILVCCAAADLSDGD